MKHFIAVVLLGFACPVLPALATQEFQAVSDWFRGGTLHNASVAEWNRATEANKLATCGDWIAAWERDGLTSKKYGSMEEIRADAVELRGCLNEAVQGLRDSEKVAPYATLCAMQLGILKRE
jgi:hypothetical protein